MNRKRQWILSGAATLSVTVVLSLPASSAHAVKMTVTQFLSPLLSVATQARQAATRRVNEPRTHGDLLRHNQELVAHIEATRERLQKTAELELENQRLQEMLGFAKQTPWKKIPARVIGRDASNWWKTILLDRGSADGLAENMAVLVPDGVVGKTIEVGQHVSRVLLIADPNCKVSALLQSNREHGIVEGIGASTERDPRCQMNFIARAASVKEGDMVVASGLGGAFPKGAVIGHVESVSAGGLYQTVGVKPAADLARLEEVFVVLGGL